MEINCEFLDYSINSEKLYMCIVTKVSITEKDHVIKEFKGVHETGKSHKDVQCVWFDNTTVNHFPRGLEKHFPNLTHLVIKGCGIKEITKSDLLGLERLELLWIQKCQLTSLPDDLFTAMPNLRKVSFAGNKIEFASSKLLKPLVGRKSIRVNLRYNKNINALYSPSWSNSLGSLEELMKLIDEKCIKPTVVSDLVGFDPVFKEMWISGNFSDLTIIAGDKKFKVHKNILGMRSEVFAQMFEDQNEATEIRISGFSQNSVEALLKFIYTNEASEENANENFEIADKFKVAKMKSLYEKVISDQINEANAWETFLFAHRHSSQLLKERAFHQIARNFKEDLPDEFMEDPQTLKKLLDAREVYDVARRACEEILLKSKKLKLANN